MVARLKRKTKVATIKLTPDVRRAWEAAAAAEHRSLANVFEVAILEYVRRHRIEVPAAPKEAQDSENLSKQTEGGGRP